jgi:hypothetical protein
MDGSKGKGGVGVGGRDGEREGCSGVVARIGEGEVGRGWGRGVWVGNGWWGAGRVGGVGGDKEEFGVGGSDGDWRGKLVILIGQELSWRLAC